MNMMGMIIEKAAAVGTATTWNPSDKSSSASLSGGNLILTSTTSAWSGVRSVTSHFAGKFYCEVTCGGTALPAYTFFGVANAGANLDSYLSVDPGAAVLTGNNGFYCNGVSMGVTDGISGTQTAGMAVDFGAKKLWFWNSDTLHWNADVIGNQNPALGIGGLDFSAIGSGPWFIVAQVHEAGDVFAANFGASAFAIGTPPSGFGNP
ncbi:MAG: hypothetical protein J0H42_25765 [Rhizobiales bacterium]|nr:hypothetical protein [Hyphomicrobiales bacterium]